MPTYQTTFIKISIVFFLDHDVLLDENAQLKDLVDKLESDKLKLKARVKELNEENQLLQKKYLEASTFGSEREDSPDVLSELDKQEELLNNISQKNKHIKRLLRDIEMLEQQNGSHQKQVNELQIHLNEATNSLTLVTNQIIAYKQKQTEQSHIIDDLNAKIVELTTQIGHMDKNKIDREIEIENFGRQLEERAIIWKQMLEDKDDRLESLRSKYEDVLQQNPGYDIDSERIELKRLSEAISERDELITELETKIISLSKEMMSSTDIMNKLANERESFVITTNQQNTETKHCTGCAEIRVLYERANNRCHELQDMISNIEDDNILKSKQAMDANEALALFKSGEDGLAQTLKKNTDLQNKVHSRDKHIRSLIMELNSLQELAQENIILR